MMRTIAITLPHFFPEEVSVISRLLREGGVWRVHIRKPGATEDEIREFLDYMPLRFLSRLSLHDCQSIAEEYGCGVHLNSRYPEYEGARRPAMLSKSCHSIEELKRSEGFDYLFLSPVLDSISKPGYTSKFSIEELRGHVGANVFALGGVTPERFGMLEDLGFGGAAMLGYFWQNQ